MNDRSSFATLARSCTRMLIIDFGGLGDHIQSLPALWALRQNMPQTKLEVLGGAELFAPLAPWIDRALPIEPGHGLGQHLRQIGALRRGHYDATIVITSSNHAVAYGGLCGAGMRLARKADENKRWFWQPWLLTHVVEVPFHNQPMYRQRLQAMKLAGFDLPPLASISDVPVNIDPSLRRATGIGEADDGTYIHLSASATDDRRDLPSAQMIELWRRLQSAFPQLRFVVTSNSTPRGLAKLAEILGGLSFTPWKIFAGNLDTASFASVVKGAALHIGPDSGGLHVARLAGTPSVSWFRPNHHIRNWLPDEASHLAFTAPESREDGLYGIDATQIVSAASKLTMQGLV